MSSASDPEIIVYWRPGCGFCSTLHRDLEASGLTFRMRNIWDDPDAAAFVRSVARGNETVPTVSVGDTSLVNPRITEIEALVAAAQSGQARNA
jgi:mycoredoxin